MKAVMSRYTLIVLSVYLVVQTARAVDKSKTCQCGMENLNMLSANGRKSPLLYPWMASLITSDSNSFCGAVLIDKSVVLTSASCVSGKSTSDFKVVLGVHNHGMMESGDMFLVKKVIVHPEFKRQEAQGREIFANDLAVLQLDKELTFSEDLLPICLSTKDEYGEQPMNALGWGQMSNQTQDVAKVLMEVFIPEVKTDRCSEVWGFDLGKERLCAGGGEKNFCKGDEGGPLMFEAGHSRWTLAGIASFSGPRCGDKFPGVFTRVSPYLSWIKESAPQMEFCAQNSV